MYADRVTESMRVAIEETDRRRRLQAAYNEEHGITPASIVKAIDSASLSVYHRDYSVPLAMEAREVFLSQREMDDRIAALHAQMRQAAANLDFERAAALRDKIKLLKGRELGVAGAESPLHFAEPNAEKIG